MEKRTANVIISAVGGTASKSSKTYKISLPTKWIKAMGIDEFNKELEIAFDGEKVIIAHRLSFEEFVDLKTDKKHELQRFTLYNEDTICAVIVADFTDKTVAVKNFTNNLLKTAFGENKLPTWSDFESFLKERCVPKERAGIREYLDAISVDSYEPLTIIKNTEGRMAEDSQWIKIEKIEIEINFVTDEKVAETSSKGNQEKWYDNDDAPDKKYF